ncbi:hypothetical protein L596_025958 [Steinernema carpocapsae]|uniref:Uncharacterized protein n=1 Tax=Steinernema carpocapsae TaxID=34508 RepID=A0A4U5M9A8_STECR|nr:hypothetical protein L596_025958 [Steinernema carpocapsae]
MVIVPSTKPSNAKCKYEPEKKRLESQGYKVTLTAFVVGSLGTWFGRNSHCLKVLEVRRAYTRKMIPLMLSETAEYSKDIFWKHILADKYKIPANRYFNTTGHKPKTPEKSPTRAKPLPDLKRSRPPTNTPATVSKKRPRTFSLPEASPQPDVPESTAEEVHQVRQHPHSDEPLTPGLHREPKAEAMKDRLPPASPISAIINCDICCTYLTHIVYILIGNCTIFYLHKSNLFLISLISDI